MNPALAIFAKTPLPGFVKTRLSPPLTLEQSADLYRCMMLDTLARVAGLAVDVVIFYDGDEGFFRQVAPRVPLVAQTGACLGRRLEDAFAALASMGYDARVVIGTDAPDLPLAFIQQAFDLLAAEKEVVFGPAEDGGYYLVGLRGAPGRLFHDIPWSGPQVLETSLSQAAQEGFASALLPKWYDVDDIEDLRRPGLCDPHNEAPLTRRFLSTLDILSAYSTLRSL